MSRVERQAEIAGVSRDKSMSLSSVPLTLSVKEAVRYTGLSQNALYDVIAAGKLRVIRSGRLIRVPTYELERFVRDATDLSLDLADLRGAQAPAHRRKARKK